MAFENVDAQVVMKLVEHGAEINLTETSKM